MKQIRIDDDGRYLHHGIGYSEHEGYAGTADHKNRVSQKSLIAYHIAQITQGEQFEIVVNGKSRGIYTK